MLDNLEIKDKHSVITGVSLFIFILISVPEFVLRDFFLGGNSYSFCLLFSYFVIFMTFIKQLIGNNIKIPLNLLYIWLLYISFILFSFIYNKTVVASLFLQPTFIFIVSILFSNIDWGKFRKYSFLFCFIVCMLTLISSILHFVGPFNVINRNIFIDSTGDYQNAVFLSFSSSIWYLGGLTIPRLSGIFDEPGTYGFFLSVFGSALYLRKRNKLAILVFFCGLTTFSTAYFLFLLLIIPILLIKTGKKTGLIILLIAGLALIVVNFIPAISDFIRFRIEYAFSDSHNRSKGWDLSMNAILENPLFGGLLSGYETRLISASGITVFMAYIGIPAALLLLTIVLFGIFIQMKKMDYDFSDKIILWPLISALLITILNRNNLFNFSGYILSLFAVIAAAGAPGENNDYKIKKRKKIFLNIV